MRDEINVVRLTTIYAAYVQHSIQSRPAIMSRIGTSSEVVAATGNRAAVTLHKVRANTNK